MSKAKKKPNQKATRTKTKTAKSTTCCQNWLGTSLATTHASIFVAIELEVGFSEREHLWLSLSVLASKPFKAGKPSGNFALGRRRQGRHRRRRQRDGRLRPAISSMPLTCEREGGGYLVVADGPTLSGDRCLSFSILSCRMYERNRREKDGQGHLLHFGPTPTESRLNPFPSLPPLFRPISLRAVGLFPLFLFPVESGCLASSFRKGAPYRSHTRGKRVQQAEEQPILSATPIRASGRLYVSLNRQSPANDPTGSPPFLPQGGEVRGSP